MGYWGNVLRQARRETLEQVRWHSPMRMAQAFGPTVVSGAVTWSATETPAYGALASLATLAIVALAWFTERVVRIPPRLAAEVAEELAALQTALKTYNPAKADEPLERAVGYILTGEWTEMFPDDLERVVKALREIEYKAFHKEIEVWGQTHQHHLMKGIPPEIWESKNVDLTGFFEPDQPVQTQQLFDEKGCRYRFINLSVIRAQIEREWPRTAA